MPFLSPDIATGLMVLFAATGLISFLYILATAKRDMDAVDALQREVHRVQKEYLDRCMEMQRRRARELAGEDPDAPSADVEIVPDDTSERDDASEPERLAA